ncbi:LPS-assembly lipoprotein LptE [Pseudoalteromonas sp. CIP111854]|uniref:LPS-assembly lipoprotein LptE n=1 Tax=Pseudoalteromonas holothuriae TaxID=2963714 RepID=A0A9W4QR50_9GAMM|nr:LPS assembly lipoprotein LptE [Pseudoalteromonas sp. CIP111854]CAH9049505.1 LPS-assembly lipoprotein LptE [Pseudoalteromonas sp. CIP111854]
MRFSAFIKHGLALALVCVLLSSCGFHLKKASYLPVEMRTLQLSGDDTRAQLYELLVDDLQQAKVTLIPEQQNNSQIAKLHLYRDTLDKQTLSLFKNGQVAQYQLSYGISYRLTRPNQEPIEQSFELYRNYKDDPDNALAKAKELDLLLNELRQLASKRIVRELSQL